MSKPTIPKPSIDLNAGGGSSVRDATALLCNPLYAGIGPYPPIVDDATWVAAAAKAIKEDGAEQWLVNMLYTLRTYIPTAHDDPPSPAGDRRQ